MDDRKGFPKKTKPSTIKPVDSYLVFELDDGIHCYVSIGFDPVDPCYANTLPGQLRQL